MTEQELIQAEIKRIKSGTQSGWFTFLHHEGPIVEKSSNVMERVYYILREKPPEEILARLQHIYLVPTTAQKAYQKATAAAQKAYQKATAAAQKAYQKATAAAAKPILALIPDCRWNGKTILAKL